MTRTFFRRLPIRHKLVTMIMATSTAVLLLASVGFLATDYVQSRRNLLRDLNAQAQLILENSAATLQFEDQKTAAEIVRSLGANGHIRTACMYLKDGRLLSEFTGPAGSQPCPAHAPPDGYRFELDRVQVARSLNDDDGRTAGSVLMRSDLDIVNTRLRVQATIITGVLILALGVALLLSSTLHALVSEPLSALARTAGDVSTRGDYSVRATRTTEDELGTLTDSFNRMLEQIQSREAELSRANEDLRRENAERRRAEQERAELLVREREANRLKDEFLATLSHELRTPLNAILGWIRLLRSNAVPAAEADRALEKIERNAQVQSRLVEDLLEVSRIASGKLRLDIRPLDLSALTTTAIDSIRPAAEARGVSIQREFSSMTLPTGGDPDRLQQVIWNLLSNAVKFTPAGGTVTVSVTRQGAMDELVVKDTGMGIDAAFLPSVFETFRQADASSTRAYGGLGLGLSIVKHLVEMHGGDVRAASDGRDQGSTFTVRLPVRALERRRERRGDVAAAPPLLLSTQVVVVDDDGDTRDLLLTVLRLAGATVNTAASAEEGLRLCLEIRPDALVSDIAMPGKDGYELVRQLIAALGDEAPRARIALTAFASPRDLERALAAGFHRHIVKPFEPAVLIRTISELLATAPTH